MKFLHPHAVLAVLLAVAAGCGSDESAGLATPKQAAAQLDDAFKAEESTTDPVYIGVRAAADALRGGDFEKAVVSLQVTRSTTNLTLDQGMAVHSSLVTLEHNLINAAAAGDAKAQRAYDLLRKSKRN